MSSYQGGRMRSGLAVVSAAIVIAGCSSGSGQTMASGSASVTQQAPSVWATPVTPAADADQAEKLAAAAVTESTLPGLSAECTGAIHAQQAVNDLFGRALGEAARQVAAMDSDTTAVESAEPTPVLKADDVASTFTSITDWVPAELTADFDALHTAAEAITSAAPEDIPDVMEETSVTGAITAITDYITACQPPSSE